MKKEEPLVALTKNQLHDLKQLLETQKKDLLEKGHKAMDQLSKDSHHFADSVDHASQEGALSTEVHKLNRERNLMLKIDHALSKMDTGEYGCCVVCGCLIGFHRLWARPTATLCIECKTLEEQQERKA